MNSSRKHGREHEKTFSVRVVWENQVLGEGSGRSKKQAESAAALAALQEQLWIKSDDPELPDDLVAGVSDPVQS